MTTGHEPDSPENPLAGLGSVLLDIGDDVGALVVTMPVELAGSEVDIAPAGEATSHDHGATDGPGHDHGHGHGHGHRPHVAVIRRPIAGGGAIPSLVFPELVEGRYDLLPKGGSEVRLTVEVRGGEVTTARWPA